MTAEYRIIIPVRLASERLPRKPLLDVGGKFLLQRVWECALRSTAGEVAIATEDEAIMQAAGHFGARCLMTRAGHSSGSDRIAECVDSLGWPDDTVVVNLQGDEPLMPPRCLDQVAGMLEADAEADAASLYQLINDPQEIMDPNVVKVVTDTQGRALYFSRSVVPANRRWESLESAIRDGQTWKRHIGLYAYRAGALKRMAATDPTPLEQTERLEQLRILENGGVIVMAEAAESVPAGVDTQADLERVRRIFS